MLPWKWDRSGKLRLRPRSECKLQQRKNMKRAHHGAVASHHLLKAALARQVRTVTLSSWRDRASISAGSIMRQAAAAWAICLKTLWASGSQQPVDSHVFQMVILSMLWKILRYPELLTGMLRSSALPFAPALAESSTCELQSDTTHKELWEWWGLKEHSRNRCIVFEHLRCADKIFNQVQWSVRQLYMWVDWSASIVESASSASPPTSKSYKHHEIKWIQHDIFTALLMVLNRMVRRMFMCRRHCSWFLR